MKNLFLIILLAISFSLNAQEKTKIVTSDYSNNQVEMADGLRQEGKIYVLTGIILIILGGTITYLISIDKKVGRLEKQIKK
jgi:hypothetical protein